MKNTFKFFTIGSAFVYLATINAFAMTPTNEQAKDVLLQKQVQSVKQAQSQPNESVPRYALAFSSHVRHVRGVYTRHVAARRAIDDPHLVLEWHHYAKGNRTTQPDAVEVYRVKYVENPRTHRRVPTLVGDAIRYPRLELYYTYNEDGTLLRHNGYPLS